MKLLLTGDRHLREDCPVARLDDYWAAQERKMDFIYDLAQQVDLCLDSGDIFHHWKPSPYLLKWAMRHTVQTMSIPGNHDLPQHNLDLLDRSGFDVLVESGKIRYQANRTLECSGDIAVYRVPWGAEIPKISWEDTNGRFTVLICHTLVYQGKPPYPGAEIEGGTAEKFLKDHNFDLIVTGHNHQTVYHTLKTRDVNAESGWNGRTLINPGSMMRMTAAQIDHKPCVFIFDTDTRSYEQIFLPIEEGIVSREHIALSEYKDNRIEAFLSRLKTDVELKLSFRDNLQKHMAVNKIPEQVKEIVWEVVDGD